MDNDSNEKKPRRPRIGQQDRQASQNPENHDNANFSSHDNGYNATGNPQNGEIGDQNGYQPRPYQQRQGGYQQRPYQQRQGGYNNRYNNGGYNNGYNRYNNGYQSRPYQRPYHQQRPDFHTPQAVDGNIGQTTEGQENTTSATGASIQNQQNGYQPRPYQQRQGGYQQRPYQQRQGGYQQRPYQQRQGGYQQRPYQQRQGGYNNRPGHQQGGYNRPQQGGYNNRPGGYNNRPGQQRPRQNQFGMPYGGKSFVPRPKPVEYEIPVPDPNEQIRLNKYMANAGICSRREADEYIRQGLVKVNGEVITELGTKITHTDTVEYDEKIVTLERKCYILLNKPKDCVTTSDDPNGRMTVMDIVKGACNERIYPVGRLDRNTTGVLLLTNDGDLASKLTHPKYIKKKIYHVWTDKDISEDDMQRIADGIELDDGPIHADAISYATETDRNQAGIEIHSGRNRIVRRIFEHLGYHVTKLDRVYFAGLTKKNLPRGRWRYLTQEEVNFLKMGSFE